MDCVFFLRALKQEMKRSRITYRDLGESLNMTEAGVKKLFGRSDLSLSRAFDICKVLGLSIHDVLRASEAEMAKEKRFNARQEKFFLENPNYFYFFMKLAYERKLPEEIRSETGISERSLFRYLKKLDDLGLIQLHSNNRVTIADGLVMRVNTSGTALEKLKYRATRTMLDKMEKTNQGRLAGGNFFLSKPEIESLSAELMELHSTYSQRSAVNRNSKERLTESSCQVHTCMFMQAPFSLFDGVTSLD